MKPYYIITEEGSSYDLAQYKCLTCMGSFYSPHCHDKNGLRELRFCPMCGIKWEGDWRDEVPQREFSDHNSAYHHLGCFKVEKAHSDGWQPETVMCRKGLLSAREAKRCIHEWKHYRNSQQKRRITLIPSTPLPLP